MEKIELLRRDYRVLLFYEFRQGHNATEAYRNICAALADNCVSYHTARNWFKCFAEGKFDFDDQPHPGPAVLVDVDGLEAAIEEDPRLTTRCLADRFGCDHTTVERRLHALGRTWKYGVWIPHELSAHQLNQRIDVCMELLTSHRTTEWLRDLVTGDEKWVIYINHTRKRQWLRAGETGVPTPKNDLHPKQVMLSVWWNMAGIVHWELLPAGSTVTAEYYCEQLDHVAEKLCGKVDKVYFLHDNARPHVAKMTRQKLLELGWSVLPHPPYSPDIAPTDYHLFLSLASFLEEKKFNDEDHLKRELENFFKQKPPEFYKDGISSLPARWKQVIDTEGAYIT